MAKLYEPDPDRGPATAETMTVQDLAVSLVNIGERAREVDNTEELNCLYAAYGLSEKHAKLLAAFQNHIALKIKKLGGDPVVKEVRRKVPLSQRLRSLKQ